MDMVLSGTGSDFMSHTMSWMIGVSAGIIALFLIVSIVKDGMEYAKGYGDGIFKILVKVIFMMIIIGLIFVANNMLPDMMSNLESNTIIADNSSTEAPVQAAEEVVTEEPPVTEQVTEEVTTQQPTTEQVTEQPTTEQVAEPVANTWMPKDTLEESWNYAVKHKWTFTYKGDEMNPKYITYKYYSIEFDKDTCTVILSDK